MTSQIKTLLMDMELSYGVYFAFPSKKEQYLHARNLIHPQFCPCAAWQWENEVSRYVVKITDDQKRFRKDFRDDYIVARKLHDLMSEADIICAHNGDAFDIKHANTLFRKHGLGQIPEKKTIDTLKIARKYFAFAGNDLDTLARMFGGRGKLDKPDWAKVTDGDEDEINKAARYCLNDVGQLAIVLKEIKPYARNLPGGRNPFMVNHYGIEDCDACGSKRLHNKGVGGILKKLYIRVRCAECGHEMKGDIKMWKRLHGK